MESPRLIVALFPRAFSMDFFDEFSLMCLPLMDLHLIQPPGFLKG